MRCDLKDKKLLTARIIMTALTVAAIGFIFGNSFMSAEISAEESGYVMEFINRLLCSINSDWSLNEIIVRKLAHFTEFAILGALLTATVYLYTGKRLRSFVISVPLGICIAVGDELIQTASEGRSCEIRDMLIDSSGVIIAAICVILIITLISKRKEKLTEGVKID